MKDAEGFTIKCKWTEWQIYDDQDNKDFICNGPCAKVHCHGDDSCEYYEVEKIDLERLEEERKERNKEMICDNFCKFPDLYSMSYGHDAQDRMHDEVCNVCPLREL